jgi:hypothetical protein
MIEWLDKKHGTMQSKHVDQVLDTLTVTCKFSADFPAHSAHFSLTARRLRAAEKLATTSFVPNEQQLFTMLKQSFDHLPEFKKPMDAFNTSHAGMANQTFEKLTTFLEDQESFIADQVAGTRFADGAAFVGGIQVPGSGTAAMVTPSPAPAPTPAPAPAPARQKKRRTKKGRSASPGFDDGLISPRARRSLFSKRISDIPCLTSSSTRHMEHQFPSRPVPSHAATSTDAPAPSARTTAAAVES